MKLRFTKYFTTEEAARYSNDEVFTKYRHMFAQAFERLYQREQRSK